MKWIEADIVISYKMVPSKNASGLKKSSAPGIIIFSFCGSFLIQLRAFSSSSGVPLSVMSPACSTISALGM